MIDINREFPYDWKTGDCAQSVTHYIEKLRAQVLQVKGMAPRYPKLAAFVNACHSRPAWQRAREKGGAYYGY